MPPEPRQRFDWLHSVRARITIVAAAVVGIVLIVGALALMRLQESAAIANLDEILSDEAESIAVAVGNGDEIPTLFDDDRVMLIRGPDGDVLAFDGAASDLFDLDLVTRDDRGATVDLDGEAHRVVVERYATTDGVGRVYVAEPLDEMHDIVDDLGSTLRWIIPLTIVLLVVLVWWLVGLTLHPVEKMRREVSNLGIRQLDHRVRVPRGGDEVTRLAMTLNQMLSRLEAAVRRQQRFVADASHELRTPLARMRAEIEADTADPTAADPEASRQSQLDEIDALQQLVDNMLVLARADANVDPVHVEPVDLDDLVLDEVRAARTHTTIPIDVGEVSGAQVVGTADDLRRVIRNLLDNSVRHAASQVSVALTEDDGVATFVVDDDGVGIPDERRAEVFERFRTQGSSSAGRAGSGLGLAIVDEIVGRHGGTIVIDDSPLGGARFVISLPLADAAAAASR